MIHFFFFIVLIFDLFIFSELIVPFHIFFPLLQYLNPFLLLIQAKELVEKAPVVIKEGLKPEEAEAMKKLLTEAGATVEIL